MYIHTHPIIILLFSLLSIQRLFLYVYKVVYLSSLISLFLNPLKASFSHDVPSLLNILVCNCENKDNLWYNPPSQDMSNVTIPFNVQTPFRFCQLSQLYLFPSWSIFPFRICVTFDCHLFRLHQQIFSVFLFLSCLWHISRSVGWCSILIQLLFPHDLT